MKRSNLASSLVAMLALVLTACADPQEISDMRSKIDEVQAQQKDVLAKLDALAKGQKDILAKSAAAPAAKPDAPDPNKRHNIPIGNSFTKGPATASVVLTEWSDFQ